MKDNCREERPMVVKKTCNGRLGFWIAFASLALSLIGPSLSGQAPLPQADDVEALKQQVAELSKAGKYDEAIPIAKKILELREAQGGAENPGNANSLYRLAELYAKKRDYAKAEPLYQRALNLQQRSRSTNDLSAALMTQSLADLYAATREYEKAEALYLRGVRIRESFTGPESAETGFGFYRLGKFYNEWGQFAKALPTFQRALAIFEKAQGPTNRNTLSACTRVGFSDRGRNLGPQRSGNGLASL
jgi:tetratricopeptide (TPR) repeat protein